MPQRIVVPNSLAIFEEWRPRLRTTLREQEIVKLFGQVEALLYAARDRELIGLPEARERVREHYGHIRATLCRTPLGVRGRWPNELDFWQSTLGRALFYSMQVVYGEDLLSQREVAERLGFAGKWRVSQVAQLQRRGTLDFIIDPDARNPRRDLRRVTVDMLNEYVFARAEEGEDDEDEDEAW